MESKCQDYYKIKIQVHNLKEKYIKIKMKFKLLGILILYRFKSNRKKIKKLKSKNKLLKENNKLQTMDKLNKKNRLNKMLKL